MTLDDWSQITVKVIICILCYLLSAPSNKSPFPAPPSLQILDTFLYWLWSKMELMDPGKCWSLPSPSCLAVYSIPEMLVDLATYFWSELWIVVKMFCSVGLESGCEGAWHWLQTPCHSRPIRGQYPGHVITLDQSEASIQTPCHSDTTSSQLPSSPHHLLSNNKSQNVDNCNYKEHWADEDVMSPDDGTDS